MPDNSLMIIQVTGENIIFKNFSGSPRLYNEKGNRDFCLLLDTTTLKSALEAKGCTIKKLKDSGADFVKIKIPKNMAIDIDDYFIDYQSDTLFKTLDKEKIILAELELIFHKAIVNNKEYTSIYLKKARFNVTPGMEIRIYLPKINNTEETNMEKMTRAEVMGQLQLGITAFEMNESSKKDPIISKLMCAMKNAIEYIGEVPKSETRVKTVTIERNVKLFPEIKQVIFNGPATVVIWSDDVKTVVKCQEGDIFDREKGISMAICKRLYGNESNFNNMIKKWTEPKTKKAERMAQAEANKTAKGKSKAGKKKALDKARKNDKTMVVLTDAYRTKLRIKMAEKGWTYAQLAEKAGLGKSTVTRLISTAKQKFMPTKIRRDVFNKLNNALGIRWKG